MDISQVTLVTKDKKLNKLMIREPIAIIGMGCHFASANNLSEFWQINRDGIDAITESPSDRRTEMPGWGGFLKGIEKFDAAFFGISLEEAIKIDPQHRLLLEVTWEALENAGLIPANLAGTNTGVFTGVSGSEYLKLLNEDPTFSATIGTVECMLANRISSYFDFRGPSLVINTTCSSGIVAMDQACQNLWNREISLALVGGTNLTFSSVIASRFSNADLLSKDGRCKVFDTKADGYVRGEGVGVVVLKRLSQAQADGDRIYAVIRGSGINHNGRGNGLTAPNMQAQIDLLKKVYQQANINPNSINYIEAHGTATLIGDALEMKALGAVVGKDRTPDNPCRVGCVKTNIGHTEAASGIAGLIKTALSLYHRQIPPTLHFQEPNPSIPFKKLGLKVQETLESLPEEMYPIRAGVSAFGLGGTNAHVVLEEYPSQAKSESITKSSFPLKVLTLTAKTAKALQELAIRYQAFLKEQPTVSLDDICFTANTRRSHFKHRLAIITESKEQLSEQLNSFIKKEALANVLNSQVDRRKPAPICFICSGETVKIKSLIKSFYHNQVAIYPPLHECELILASYFEKSFLELIDQDNFEEIFHYELINFICEYAIAQLWRYFGIEPVSVIGNGTGNYVSATISGILNLEEAVSLILKKSTLEDLNLDSRSAKISMISPITGCVIKLNQVISRDQWQQEFNVDFNNFRESSNQFIDANYTQLDISANQIRCYEKNKLDLSLDLNNLDNITHDLNEDNLQSLLSNIIKFWLMGTKVNWAKVDNYKNCYPISLPTYPFERQSYWIGSVSDKPQNDGDRSINQEIAKTVDYQSTKTTIDFNTKEDLSGEFVAPRDELELQLTKIWEKVLRRKPIGVRDNFFDLGGSSLMAIKLFAQFEMIFQTNMPISVIFQAPTIEELAKIFRQEKDVSSLYSLVPIQTKGSLPILFAIHWLYYTRDLSKYLGENQPIYGLNFGIGHSNGHVPPLTTIEELARHYIEEIQALQPQSPYFLMGHSFGGLVAYEMAQQLLAKGEQIGLIALLDTFTILGEKLPIKKRLINIFSFPRKSLKIIIVTIQKKLQNILKSIKKVMSKYLYHPNLSIESLVKAYTLKTYSGQIHLFKAMDSFSISSKVEPPEVNLQKLVMGNLEIHEIPGSHMGMLEEPNVQVLAEKLTACIDKALRDCEI